MHWTFPKRGHCVEAGCPNQTWTPFVACVQQLDCDTVLNVGVTLMAEVTMAARKPVRCRRHCRYLRLLLRHSLDNLAENLLVNRVAGAR